MKNTSYNVAGSIRPGTLYEPRAKRNARQQKRHLKRVAMWRLVDTALIILGLCALVGVGLIVESI
jgi:hypothetical protein